MYLIDADVFIQAKNAHYTFDFCPGFWAWIANEHAAGRAFSVAKVRDELLAGKDELATWAGAVIPPSFFLPVDGTMAPSLAATSGWANGQQYTQAAIADFFAKADYFLVAQAHALNFKVVTQEVAADSVNKIKVPNACTGLNIDCVSTFAFLRAAGIRLII